MEPRCNHLGNRSAPTPRKRPIRASMEPRCNHLGNRPAYVYDLRGHIASMEPRCNHLGNTAAIGNVPEFEQPQWSPGVITWETPAGKHRRRPAVPASMEPRCNHLGNSAADSSNGARYPCLNGAQV